MKVELELSPMLPAAERGLFSLAPDPPRPARVRREEAALRGLRAGRLLPVVAAAGRRSGRRRTPAPARRAAGASLTRRGRRDGGARVPGYGAMTIRRGLSGSRVTAPRAISRTASGTSACSSGRSSSWISSGSLAVASSIAALRDDRPGVDAAVVLDEVHRHAEDLDAVVERLLRSPGCPGNAGSSDGWTFTTAPGKRLRNGLVRIAM